MNEDKVEQALKTIYGDNWQEFHDYSAGDLEEVFRVAYTLGKYDLLNTD